jgi:hypothetical protein
MGWKAIENGTVNRSPERQAAQAFGASAGGAVFIVHVSELVT